jgi:hypothetical protein
VRRKIALLVLYSALLLVAGYVAGRSAATTAAPAEIRSVRGAAPLATNAGDSEPMFTDWPDLTPE